MRISDLSSDVCSSDLHGSSAQGAIGFPNLSDDIWHWGGAPEDILTSILDGREGVMPEWGTVLTGMGGDSAVISVVAYVRTLSDHARSGDRSEERRVGKECVSTCRSRWSTDHSKKNI